MAGGCEHGTMRMVAQDGDACTWQCTVGGTGCGATKTTYDGKAPRRAAPRPPVAARPRPVADRKPAVTLDALVWANRAAEHRRDRCAECAAGGCLSSVPEIPVVAIGTRYVPVSREHHPTMPVTRSDGVTLDRDLVTGLHYDRAPLEEPTAPPGPTPCCGMPADALLSLWQIAQAAMRRDSERIARIRAMLTTPMSDAELRAHIRAVLPEFPSDTDARDEAARIGDADGLRGRPPADPGPTDHEHVWSVEDTGVWLPDGPWPLVCGCGETATGYLIDVSQGHPEPVKPLT